MGLLDITRDPRSTHAWLCQEDVSLWRGGWPAGVEQRRAAAEVRGLDEGFEKR